MAVDVTNKKSKIIKTKPNNKKLIKFSWRHLHRHIDSHLLPSVALFIAIPSAKKINISSSHSSVVIAIGFITKVAQLIVGDHGILYPQLSSASIFPDDSGSITASQSDSLYAKVSKKRKFRPNDTKDIQNISSASELEEVPGDAENSFTSEKCSSAQSLKLKSENQSKKDDFQVIPPQDKQSLVSHCSIDNKFTDTSKTKEEFNECVPKDSMKLKEEFSQYVPKDFIKLKALNVNNIEKSSSKDRWIDTIQNKIAVKKNVSIDNASATSSKNMSFQKDALNCSTKGTLQNKSENLINHTLLKDGDALKLTSKQKKYKNDFASNNVKDNEIKFNGFDEDLQQFFSSLNALIEKGSSHGHNFSEFKHSIGKLNQYSEMLNETLRNVNCNLFADSNDAFHNSQLIEFQENMNHFKNQNEILCSENEALRDIVMRLNQEVSNFKKAKENAEDKHITNEYISGLLVSYAQQLKEKDDIIASLKEVNDSMIPEDKWNTLKEQAKIVLEEYEDSMKQINLYKETICKLTNENSLKMIERLTETTKEKKNAEQELLELKEDYSLLKSQSEKLEKSHGSMIFLVDHHRIVENLNNEHNIEMNKLFKNMDDMSFKLSALTKERDTLAVQTSELYAENLHVLSQLKTVEKLNRTQKKQLDHQIKEIESLKRKDIIAKETLSQVIKVAEFVRQERDNLTDIINQKKSDELLTSHQENVELKKLQHNLKLNKLRAKKKLQQVNQRLEEQNEEFDQLRKTYENELNDLKDIVRQKQNHIERLNFNKSSYDERFNELWSSFHENDKV